MLRGLWRLLTAQSHISVFVPVSHIARQAASSSYHISKYSSFLLLGVSCQALLVWVLSKTLHVVCSYQTHSRRAKLTSNCFFVFPHALLSRIRQYARPKHSLTQAVGRPARLHTRAACSVAWVPAGRLFLRTHLHGLLLRLRTWFFGG